MSNDVIVVGAGFGGMYMLHRLRQSGFSTQVIEAGDNVGGTWYWNRYPGARCDVESLDYSYSFDPALQQEWEWSEKYATQPEILRYANHVADRFDLRRDILFNTRVTAASYDEAQARWTVTLDNGETRDCQFLVFATGCLSVPKPIDIEGLEQFKGTRYHSADWPREGVDFSGQRVAVIGTGSSAIQSIPIIASQAKRLTVYQRTPAFSLPALNRPLDREEIRNRKAKYEQHRQLSRYSSFGVPDPEMLDSALEVDERERNRRFQAGWDQGTLVGILQSFNDLLVSKEANDTACEFVRNKIRETVDNPDVAETLCPDSFPIGTKRACLDSGYYDTFNQPHVELVDLKKTPIECVTESGIRTSAGEREFDSIVCATGFDAMTGAISNVDIRGKDGLCLRDCWAGGSETYLGLQIAGFPNLFTITGPGSPSVMSNMMISIEQHVDWIADCLDYLKHRNCQSIEATSEAQQAWVAHVNEIAQGTLFPLANSWYMGANVPGKPTVFMPYIGGVGPYREKCEAVVAADYEGFVLTGSAAAASAG